MTRICIVNDKFTLKGGGGQYRILGIARGLKKFGYQIELCCPYFNTSELYNFKEVKLPKNWLKLQFDNILLLYKRIKRAYYDKILFELPCPVTKGLHLFTNLKNRENSFIDIGDFWYSDELNPIQKYGSTYLMKKICQKVQKISVATEAMRKYLKKLLPKKEILKISCGVDFELFYKKRHPTLSINEDGAKIILYQGQINEFTGCHYIPNIAFDLIFKLKQEDIKFLIVGGGPYLKTLKKEIDRKKMSNYFIFTGPVPHSTIPNYIAEASICLALSPSRFDVNMGVFPIKIVEYMAMNKLVVSTNIAEVYHLISDWQTGVISTPSNIAQNISKLLDDIKLIELIGKNAGKTAKLKYDWKVIIKELLNFWEIS